MQNWQDTFRLSQPFKYRVAHDHVVGLGQLAQQRLPGCLDERCRLTRCGKAGPCPFEHGLGRFGQGKLVPALGQP